MILVCKTIHWHKPELIRFMKSQKQNRNQVNRKNGISSLNKTKEEKNSEIDKTFELRLQKCLCYSLLEGFKPTRI